ncbi:sugar ABC transporter permease [Kitasatospora paracochleata]|uniref:Multiple sugar transport system permease protein n=1 Tax=Kitasatospora paracochleata TaxID=58354 RepID=A0ABT1IWA4_9ACTN|nr:sugar ABC transporter permease [Kitasatospora paracochleata]MCP2309423.1 multiple sugar transport system permease protein [Kitasatospora paracochleata]
MAATLTQRAGEGFRAGRPATTPRNGRRRLTKALHFLTFGAPGLLIYLALVMLPIVMTVRTSFTNRNPANPPTTWVGLHNYTRLLHDSDFTGALWNTVIVSVIVTVAANALGLAIALLLDRPGRLYNLLRSVFFTPVVLSSVVVSVIWQAILADDGLLDTVLRNLGVADPPGWLSDPDIALYSVASIITWQTLGFCVVVYLAGLAGVPTELLEAAEIDGAGRLARFRHVTWPMLAPAVTINTIMLLISGFKAFDQIQVLTNGGPGNGTTSTIAFQVVQTTFTGNHIGYGAAMATAMLVIIAALAVLALRILQRREVTL